MGQPGNSGIEPIERKGFPRDTNRVVNALIDREDRTLRIEFDTDRTDPGCAKVIETAESITWHLPRNPIGTGASTDPYIMGTNSTTSGDLSQPQDDVWDINDPPLVPPVTGVKTVGVRNITPTRQFQGATNSYDVDKNGGGVYTINVTERTLFSREEKHDSLGNLILIQAEYIIGHFTDVVIT